MMNYTTTEVFSDDLEELIDCAANGVVEILDYMGIGEETIQYIMEEYSKLNSDSLTSADMDELMDTLDWHLNNFEDIMNYAVVEKRLAVNDVLDFRDSSPYCLGYIPITH